MVTLHRSHFNQYQGSSKAPDIMADKMETINRMNAKAIELQQINPACRTALDHKFLEFYLNRDFDKAIAILENF